MDRNFDALCGRLKKMIYDSPKGQLRIELLLEDLAPFIGDAGPRIEILDAGGGFGQISLKLAELGHKVVLCDISEKMLEEAATQFDEAGLRANVEIINRPFQSLPEEYYGRFDMVMSHAVLEWLEKPFESFKFLKKFTKKGGLLSIMFYNLNSLICQNAIKGNFLKIMNEEFAGHPDGLTPANPIASDDVIQWFHREGIDIISKTGIRVFYDLMFKKMRNERAYEDILEVERKYCRIEPFASMGRYVHVLGRNR